MKTNKTNKNKQKQTKTNKTTNKNKQKQQTKTTNKNNKQKIQIWNFQQTLLNKESRPCLDCHCTQQCRVESSLFSGFFKKRGEMWDLTSVYNRIDKPLVRESCRFAWPRITMASTTSRSSASVASCNGVEPSRFWASTGALKPKNQANRWETIWVNEGKERNDET